MSKDQIKTQIQELKHESVKPKKVKKLYRCSECTNSVTLTIVADVVCTRCNVAMRLFEAEQSTLFMSETSENEDEPSEK